jgi:F-type H+-transporting ATPase subunit gamma
MPGALKEVRNRIKSVQSTQQITKAMKMQEMLSNIVSGSDDTGADLAVERTPEKVLLIVIASDRGLCGAYNANIVKLARSVAQEKYTQQLAKGNVTMWPIGKKAFDAFQRLKMNMNSAYKDVFLSLSFEHVQQVAKAAIEGFTKKEFDVVEVVYSEFRNAGTQVFTVERFLPIPKAVNKTGKATKADFIFEPDKATLIAELMPKILNTQLYKAVLDANASEHGARMTAMDKASENANELLKGLRISYNRARQAAITTELTEIVSGAAALQG